jgi:D-sedoheptulose 7-phosphate isomerase
MSIEAVLKTAIADSIEIRQQCAALLAPISEATRLIIESYRSGGKLLVFGNGGAASDAQHIVGELVGRFRFERAALPAIALVSDASVNTAIANDYGYQQVFSRQVLAHGRPGDVAIGITTSGTSQNVITGLKYAREAGLITIGMCGKETGRLSPVSDVIIDAPSSDTARIQETLMMIGHVICEGVEAEMFGS